MIIPFAKRFLPALIAACSALVATFASGQGKVSEFPGARDPDVISRYAGSVLQNVSTEKFAAVRVPASAGRYGEGDKLVYDKSVTVEGPVNAYFYVAPKERSALEVFRNYQRAVTTAGFTTLYSCELRACSQALVDSQVRRELLESRKWGSVSRPWGAFDRDVRFLSAKATRQGADVYLMVYVAEPDSIWEAPVVTVLVTEPAAMEGGKVVVNTDQLRKGLADEGKIALYGIYFDTGRAEVKPESKPQLAEMAKLLAADKSLRVVIVGHTDNQGGVDANLALSQRRADAVVQALLSEYKLDAARLRSRGVASFAPVATNRTEAGRAKNRRVELIEQ